MGYKYTTITTTILNFFLEREKGIQIRSTSALKLLHINHFVSLGKMSVLHNTLKITCLWRMDHLLAGAADRLYAHHNIVSGSVVHFSSWRGIKGTRGYSKEPMLIPVQAMNKVTTFCTN